MEEMAKEVTETGMMVNEVKEEEENLKPIAEAEEEEVKKVRGPYYHVVYHGEASLEVKSFNTKKELTRHLKPVRPECIVGLFKGSKLHAAISNDYQII